MTAPPRGVPSLLGLGRARRRLGRCGALLAAALGASCPGMAPSDAQPRALHVLTGADVKTLDPQVPFDNASYLFLGNIFDSLVRYDNEFGLSSGLALRWINPDERTWRFFLDPEARFSDGSPARAADVKFSIDRLRGLSGSPMQWIARHIVSAEVIDPRTVDLHTDTSIAILNSLSFIPIMSEARVREAPGGVSDHPLGTGPYALAGWEKGHSLVLEANPHHRPAPPIRRIEFTIRPAAVAEDVRRIHPELGVFLATALAQDLAREGVPGLRVANAGGLSVFYVSMNVRPRLPGSGKANPLRDPRLRRALALAIDRDAVLRERGGFGRPANQLVVPEVFGYDPRFNGLAYAPERASDLVRQIGASGLDLPITAPKGNPNRVAHALAELWSRAGVRARLEELPAGEVDRVVARGDFLATVAGYGCSSADASELLNFALRTPSPEKGFGPGNSAGYSHPEVDRISDENISVLDPMKRLGMLQRALRIAEEELAYVPLYSADDVYLVADGIQWKPRVSGDVRFDEMSFRAPGSGSR